MIADRWGVTDAEIARHYPCDDVVPDPAWQLWRGVTVNASADLVWPWIAQIRLAPYSYDWIDNWGRRSPRSLRGLAEPRAGEHFTTTGTVKAGTILSVDPGRQLTGRIMGAVMSYVLVPHGETTRLLLKLVARGGRRTVQFAAAGELVMARRQLLNLKRLAEAAAR